ncbi:hypothetical protein IKF89_01335 [Candidatus Saccharibacteria bacterium]|nr:hypothetical protein [Candidatus Saccharibacteria bacterium]
MKRLFVVYNPRSSRYASVKAEVLERLNELAGFLVGKYEVEKIGIEGNVEKLAKLLKDGDTVLAAGGDATGVIAANAIMQSGCDVTLAVLPYGNFNDLARTLGTNSFDDVFDDNAKVRKFYSLEVIVDGKHWRYATCYVTMGMTAEAVKLYDAAKMRKVLKKKWGRYVGSYTNLMGWYFKHRHKKEFIPEFKLNGVLQDKRISDYAAVNGRSMARVMKGGEDYYKPREFRREVGRLTSFWRLFDLMVKSIFVRTPGEETKGDVLEFVKSGRVEVQAEGESQVFEGMKKIEVRKAKKCLKVIEGWQK